MSLIGDACRGVGHVVVVLRFRFGSGVLWLSASTGGDCSSERVDPYRDHLVAESPMVTRFFVCRKLQHGLTLLKACRGTELRQCRFPVDKSSFRDLSGIPLLIGGTSLAAIAGIIWNKNLVLATDPHDGRSDHCW